MVKDFLRNLFLLILGGVGCFLMLGFGFGLGYVGYLLAGDIGMVVGLFLSVSILVAGMITWVEGSIFK